MREVSSAAPVQGRSDEFLDRLRTLLGPDGLLSEQSEMAAFLVGPTRTKGSALCVARPSSTEDVSNIVRLAQEYGFSVVPQGGNTGLSDGATPLDGETVVLSLSRMTRIRDVDPHSFSITLEAGTLLVKAQEAASKVGLMLPFSIGSEGSCTIGGNLATNAGGKSALRYGTAAGLALGLEVVLADGQVWNGLRSVRKDNTGFDTKQIFLGSEGRYGIITAASLSLVPAPTQSATAFVALPSPEHALQLLSLLRRRMGDLISAFELMNRFTLATAVKHLDGQYPFEQEAEWSVLMEVATSSSVNDLGERLLELLEEAVEDGLIETAVLAQSEQQARDFWRLRDDGATQFWKEGGFLLHDPAVPLSKVPDFIRLVDERTTAFLPGIRIAAFGHVGDGNIHVIASQPLEMDKKQFVALKAQIQAIIYGAATELGGSFSAEHGVGHSKTAALSTYRDAVHVGIMDRIKLAMDPTNLLNPGKVRPVDLPRH